MINFVYVAIAIYVCINYIIVMASSNSLEECFLSDSPHCSTEMNKMYIPPLTATTTITTTTITSEIVIAVQKMTDYNNQTELVIGKGNLISVDFPNSELVLSNIKAIAT